MKKIRKSTAILLSLMLAAGMLSGCGGKDAVSTTAAAGDTAAETSAANREGEVNQEAHQGEKATDGERTMTFGIQNYSAGSLDPAGDTSAAWNATRYGVSECLFQFDNSMNVVNCLCDEYSVNDEHTEWVFHIREGVKFSDGCDLTAEAVKACFF